MILCTTLAKISSIRLVSAVNSVLNFRLNFGKTPTMGVTVISIINNSASRDSLKFGTCSQIT